MLTPEHDQPIGATAELAIALRELDNLLEQTRQEERIRIADWLGRKSQTAPAEGRMLYRLLAKEIQAAKYLEAP